MRFALIHVINIENSCDFHELLEEHHIVRHRVFVEERGWQDLKRADGREMDAYDTEHTVYFLAVEDGRVIGGHRLLPTTNPHMLADVFPFLVDARVPTGPTIMEWSRFFIVPERRGGPTYFELMAAVQEYGLLHAITQMSAVVEEWWLPRFDHAGFTYTVLGRPSLIENVPTLAILIDIRRDSLRRVRDLGGLRGSVFTGHTVTGHDEPPNRPWPRTIGACGPLLPVSVHGDYTNVPVA